MNDFVSFTPGTCSNLSDEAVLDANDSIGDDEGDSSLHQYNRVSPTIRQIWNNWDLIIMIVFYRHEG